MIKTDSINSDDDKIIDNTLTALIDALDDFAIDINSIEWRAVMYMEDCCINDDEFHHFFEWSLHDPVAAGNKMQSLATFHLRDFVADNLDALQQRLGLGKYKDKDE